MPVYLIDIQAFIFLGRFWDAIGTQWGRQFFGFRQPQHAYLFS